jgi:hypothetical protein
MISHHSSRLRRQVFTLQARLLQQLRVELRLDRADRDVLAVPGLVHVVEMRTGVQHVGAAFGLPPAALQRPVEDRHERRRSVHHRGVDDLAATRLRALDQRARDAEGQQHPAAAEVADQVERRHRGLAAAADRVEGSRQGDVVDVVAGGLRQRPLLPPAGHAPVHQARVPPEADLGPEPQPLHHARPEALQQCVGPIDQAQHGGQGLGALEVDGDAAAAPGQEVQRRILGIQPEGVL